ncbi:hypothetical protein LCGC14_1329060 [marine sediment metagenome]|uniref:Baseplate protein J-like domain-containing protein n=1 Tax=marine sediment metagenome TaxID=412755 RepID=A0A0F9KH57_9ZZZZ
MATDLTIPSFDWTAQYYPELLEALIQFKRTYVPEHTDESAYDGFMQLLSAFACVGHINNSMIDLVANESTLPTSKLVEQVRNMLRLIDYEMASATPAQADIVYELSKVLLVVTEVVPLLAQAATKREIGVETIWYEALAALTVDPTDEFSSVFAEESGAFVDYTMEANAPTINWTPWSTPAEKDAIYFGHSHIMWDKLGLWLATPMEGTKATGTIQFVAKASLVDGEKFVLDDGTNSAVTFWFNQTGGYTPSGGYDATNIEVDISGDTTAGDVAITAKAAINGVTTGLLITGGAIVAADLSLENDGFGTAGNQAITETVVNAGFTFSGMSSGTDGVVGIWEYYDGDFVKADPDAVTDETGYLRLRLDTYLGAANRAGTKIRVQFNSTGAYEDAFSAWSGSYNYVDTSSYLGQTVPSTTPADYTVGSDWEEFTGLTDGTEHLSQNGDVEFDLPQTISENWVAGIVNLVTAYWMRFRVITAAGVTVDPVFQYGRLDQGKQYVYRQVTQGKTQSDNPLGSSDGLADQEFETTQDNYIDGSGEPYVDAELWTVVANFLQSKSTDKHCRVKLGKDDRATLVFGDGINGKIPPAGVGNVRFDYRHDADDDGNAGYNTIVVDKSGLSYVNSLWNPRPAAGWKQAEGATPASLELAKVDGPASLRVKTVALNADDVVNMTKAYEDADGASPFVRAKGIEEGFGVKTLKLVVVAAGGDPASPAQLDALDEFFNGDAYAHPPVRKRFISNQEVTSVNYTQELIDITATVYGVGVVASEIENRLQQIIQPEAVKADGITWEWEFGATVTRSRIIHEIFEVSEEITNVVLAVPASDVVLQIDELPKAGTLLITVVG